MLPAVLILFFAWTIASVINDLETGKYLAKLAIANIASCYLPALLFLLTGFIAFSCNKLGHFWHYVTDCSGFGFWQ